MVGGPGRAALPLIQSANVTPGGASHPPSASPDAQQLGVEHAPGPRHGRVARRGSRRGGALRVEREPRGEPGRLPPGAPPVQHRRVRERRDQHRAQGVHRRPAVRDVGPLPRVDAHLHGGGGAHPAAAPRADPVEAVLHGAVAREVEHAARRPQRIRGERGDGEAVGVEPLVQVLGVGGDGSDEGAEGGQRRAGQLHLATGFDGDRGATRQGAGRGGGVQRGWRVRAEGGAQHRGVQRGGGRGGLVHQPFQLHAGEPRGTVLETDRGDVHLGVVHGAQQACSRGRGPLLPGTGLPRSPSTKIGASRRSRVVRRHASDATRGHRQFRADRRPAEPTA